MTSTANCDVSNDYALGDGHSADIIDVDVYYSFDRPSFWFSLKSEQLKDVLAFALRLRLSANRVWENARVRDASSSLQRSEVHKALYRYCCKPTNSSHGRTEAKVRPNGDC